MKKLLLSALLASGILTATVQADVTISSQSYQKVIKKKKASWVKATKVVPGSEILYINTLTNKGNDTAQKLTVVNAVPEHMEFIKGTAVCKSKCDVRYSVDGGKTFGKPKNLYVGKGKKRHRAKASEYTTIMWVVDKLKGDKKTNVQYKARLK